MKDRIPKFLMIILFAVCSRLHASVMIDLKPGADLWGDSVGFTIPVMFSADFRTLFGAGATKNWFAGVGGSVAGVYLDNFSLMNYSVCGQLGLRLTPVKGFPLFLAPSVSGGWNASHRFNAFRQDLESGPFIAPAFDLEFASGDNLVAGPGVSASFRWSGTNQTVSVSAYLKLGFVLSGRAASHDDPISLEIRQILKEDRIEALEMVGGNGVKFFIQDSLFAYDSDRLNDQEPERLRGIVEVVRMIMQFDEAAVFISGFTDDIGDEKKNLLLSESRAKSVADLFIKLGFPRKKLLYKGFGSATPRVPNDSDENRARNRRVEINILWQ